MDQLSLEIVRAGVFVGVLAYLYILAREKRLLGHKGLAYILTGGALVLFGLLLDISENIPWMSRLIILGPTYSETLVKNMVGFVAGFFLIIVGIAKWMGGVSTLREVEEVLERSHGELERRVLERTAELSASNRRLEKEIAERKKAEAALQRAHDELERSVEERTRELQDSEQRLQGLMASLTDDISVIDEDYTIVWANDVAKSLSGSDMIGKKCYSAYHQRDRICDDCMALKTLSDGRTHNQEVRRTTADGQTSFYWITTSVVTVHDDGRPRHILAISRDITDRKKAEDALRASEKRYRKLVDLLPVGVGIHTGGKIVFVNPAAVSMFGAAHTDELIGRSILDIVHPMSRETVIEQRQTIITEWKPAPMTEITLQQLDGTVRQAEVHAAPIMHEGKPSVLVAAVDITDRKLLENEVKESEARFREFAELLPQFVYELDTKGTVVFMNRAGREAHGYTEETIGRGVNLIEKLIEEDRKRASRHLDKILEGSISTGAEYVVRRKDGTNFPVFAHSSRIVREGNVVGIRGIAFDITERKQAEEAILEERRKFRDLAENAPFGLVMIGENGVYQYLNPAFEEMFGYSLNDIPSGREWFRKAFPEPDARHSAIEAWIEDLKTTPRGGGRPRVFTTRCKDGTDKVVHFVPVQLESGEHLMTCLDITERVRAEQALLESEDKYRTLVDTSPDAIMVQVGENFAFVNSAAVTMLGMKSAGDLIGKPAMEFVHPDFREAVAERMRITFEEGRPVGLLDEKIIRHDGAVLDVEAIAAPIMYQGQPARQIVARDVTERKKTEQALEQSERKFRELAELLPQVVYETDTNGTFTFINRQGLSISGHTLEDLARGVSAVEVIAPEDRSRLAVNMGRVLRGEDPGNNEYLALRKDGTTFPSMITSTRIVHDGKVVGIRGVGMDISRIKETEAQLKASLEEKKLLLREVHHRVKNNLQVISSMIRLQARAMSDHLAKESLAVLDSRVSTIALVHEYLHRSPNLAGIAVKDHFKSVAEPILSYLGSPGKNLRLDMDVEDIFWGIDIAIPVGLMVNELVTNAVKHAFPDRSEGSIGVSLRLIDDGKFELMVSDNGVGLPKEVSLSTSKTLGLNLVNMFADQIGADVELTREGGTEFRFRFREKIKRKRKKESVEVQI